MHAINRHTEEVLDFVVGHRTKQNISKVTDTFLNHKPKMIYADGLSIYKTLISKELQEKKYNNY